MWRTIGILLLAACPVLAAPLKLVVSTTLLEGIAVAVGGDRVVVTPVIPHAMCPGHFDLSPRMAETIASSDLFMQHGFEAFARGLVLADGDARRVVLKVAGNGMVPDVHRQITAAVTDALCAARPEDAGFFRAHAATYTDCIAASEEALQPLRQSLAGVPVLAAVMNAPFIAWMGCRVAGTFPRDEGISAKALAALVRDGRRDGVRLIADNQQSLGRTGRTLAAELDVPLIVLSNFPAPEAGGYPAALKQAVESLAAALGREPDGQE